MEKYCQFAHGPEELRQPNDALPMNIGQTSFGACLSNFKTTPCKFWQQTGECKFGSDCSFYHGEEDRRRLVDPLPNLPQEVITIPQICRKGGKGKKYHINSQPQPYYYNTADGSTQFSSIGGGQ